MKKQAVKGTRDFLPWEEAKREEIKNIIEKTYQSFGYNKISTPILEDIENLTNSDGGENLKLIFKILKRGEKFSKAIENADFDNLSDFGLRYDLTLPLSRYYSQNKEFLPKPFKALQIDRVYRAERPQKDRLREFCQCDIDILGSDSLLCEVELIIVTMKALENLGLKNLVVAINSRKLIRNLLTSFGYVGEEINQVCVIFDKIDKIGLDGIKEELSKIENKNANENFVEFLQNKDFDFSNIDGFDDVSFVINNVKKINENINIQFSSSLVRGQNYYTGCVFEVYSNDLSCAIAGGGRYDGMVEKFCGEKIGCVGFSIGFERIFSLLENSNFNIKQKIAVLYEDENFVEKFAFSEKLRSEYDVCLVKNPKKLSTMLEKLEKLNYVGFVGVNSTEIKFFNK